MALHLYFLDPISETWDQIDEGDQFGLHKVNLKVSYSHPASLSFRLYCKDSERPIPDRAFVVCWDDEADPAQTVLAPAFEGHVHEMKPVAANAVEYLCYDSTMRARNEVTLMSGPHADAGVIPRIVFNATIDNDEDYGLSFANGQTVGEILATVLDHAYNEIFTNCTAAPSVPGEDCYIQAELDALTFEPQEKVVFESEMIGSAIDRLLAYYPMYRMIYIPGTGTGKRKWKFVDVTAAPEITLTLGQFADNATNLVLSRTVSRSYLQRFTAIEIYGPLKAIYASARQSLGELAEGWTSGEEINFLAGGPNQLPAGIGDCAKKWQVVDTTKRRIARFIPEGVLVPDASFTFAGQVLQYREIKEPLLQVSFDGSAFHTVPQIRIDGREGYVYAPAPVFVPNDGSFGTLFAGDWAIPVDAILHYAYYDEPEVIRWPATGFEGTAFDEGGLELAYKYFDPSFDFGYDKLRQSDYAANRIDQYEELCKQWLKSRKDVVHAGGATLWGIQWDFLRLQKRVNITSLDEEGNPETIGQETMKAILTDVEFDFESRTTTLVFDSDVLEFSRKDIDAIKSYLKIKAFSTIQQLNFSLTVGGEGLRLTADVVTLIVEEGPNGPVVVGRA